MSFSVSLFHSVSRAPEDETLLSGDARNGSQLLEGSTMNAGQFVRRHMAPIAVSACLLVLAAACGDDPTEPIEGAGDPENIVRVTVTLTPVGGGAATTSVRVDPDGTQLPQPVGAAQGTLTLTKGTTYNGTIALLNNLDPNNVVDISAEVRTEANFHRFFYTFTGGCTGVTVPVASMDKDMQATPQPLGLTFQVVVPAATASGSCTLHVELHHWEQAKGDGTGTAFDTDLSIDFPVTIS